MNCEKCGREMYKIGPFASKQHDGQKPEKWDGITKYQCTNEACENYEKFIETKV